MPGRVTGVDMVDGTGANRRLTADFYVAALPIESFAGLLTQPMQTDEPALRTLPALARDVRWMNGIQFYLNRNVRVNHGHTLHVDTPWALTSISQPQFWPGVDLTRRGDGTVKGILSVVISDFDTPGLGDTTARQAPNAQALADEVWEQLKRSLQHTPFGQLQDSDRKSFFVDPALTFGQTPANKEPLFINRPDSWRRRPPPHLPNIPNLLLAADYVRCNADLACMEAACEAGRVAVNFILAATGSRQAGCRLFPMDMPGLGAPFRVVDRIRLAAGLPWDFDIP